MAGDSEFDQYLTGQSISGWQRVAGGRPSQRCPRLQPPPPPPPPAAAAAAAPAAAVHAAATAATDAAAAAATPASFHVAPARAHQYPAANRQVVFEAPVKARKELETGRLDGESPGGPAAPPPLPPPPATLPLPPPLQRRRYRCSSSRSRRSRHRSLYVSHRMPPPDPSLPPIPRKQGGRLSRRAPLSGGEIGGGGGGRARASMPRRTAGSGAGGVPDRGWRPGGGGQGRTCGGVCRHLKEPIMAGEHRAGRRLPWPRGLGRSEWSPTLRGLP